MRVTNLKATDEEVKRIFLTVAGALLSGLWSCYGLANGYSYRLSPHNYLKERFRFEFYAESVNFEINKTGTTVAGQVTPGARAGLSAAMGITAWIAVAFSADYFIGSGEGSTASLFRFEQLTIGKLARRGLFSFGAGVQAQLLKTAPMEYGYNGLFGPTLYVGFEPRYFLMYLKGGPVSNSSSQIISNVAYSVGLQIFVWDFGPGPMLLNAEMSRIDFFATIPEEKSLLSTVSVGLSQMF